MPSQFERYSFGIISEEVNKWVKKLENSGTLYLSSLAPFIRITPIKTFGSNIIDANTTKPLNFNLSQLLTPNLKGNYALKNMDVELYGDIGSLFRINLNIDIFDSNLLENSDISSLFKLGTNAKIEFGWSDPEAAWEFKLGNKITDTVSHNGKGQELYGVVTMLNIDISERNIISVYIQLTSTSSQISNDFKLDSLFKLDSQKFKEEYFAVSQKAPRATDDSLGRGKRKSKPAISLYNLFVQLEDSIKNKIKTIGLNSISIPEYDLTFPIVNADQTLNPSLNPYVGIKQNTPNPTVGDIMITVEKILEIKENSNTVKSFINNLCQEININSLQTLDLKPIARPPAGNIISIINNTSARDINSSKTTIASEKDVDKYLQLSYYTGNTIIKSIIFSSDLSGAGKNIQNAIEMQSIQGASPIEVIQFMKTWYNDKSEDYETAANQLIAEPQEKLDEILELYPNMNDKLTIYKNFQEVIKKQNVKNNALKYLPYTLNCGVLGISDIWLGTRVWFDENTSISILKNTLWRITSLKHNISPGAWNTEFSAVCEYNEIIEKERNNL